MLDGLSLRIRWKYFISLERTDIAIAIASSSRATRMRRVRGNGCVNEIENNLPSLARIFRCWEASLEYIERLELLSSAI